MQADLDISGRSLTLLNINIELEEMNSTALFGSSVILKKIPPAHIDFAERTKREGNRSLSKGYDNAMSFHALDLEQYGSLDSGFRLLSSARTS